MSNGPIDNLPGLPSALTDAGARCGELLIARGESVAVGECSCGGLISAGLLAMPGASAFYRGGAVTYTRPALSGLLSGLVDPPKPLQGASEPWALHLARASRAHIGTDWGIGEGGATGPAGNPYGDPAGHGWLAVSGPDGVEASRHILTGSDDRAANMVAFAITALELLADTLT